MRGIMREQVKKSGYFHSKWKLFDNQFFGGNGLAVDFQRIEIDASDKVGKVDVGFARSVVDGLCINAVANKAGNHNLCVIADGAACKVILDGDVGGGRVRVPSAL